MNPTNAPNTTRPEHVPDLNGHTLPLTCASIVTHLAALLAFNFAVFALSDIAVRTAIAAGADPVLGPLSLLAAGFSAAVATALALDPPGGA